jgi:hypothetical protein
MREVGRWKTEDCILESGILDRKIEGAASDRNPIPMSNQQ